MAISESGPAAARVARNIERIRKARQMKQKDVSDRLRQLGRPMLATVVSKVERGERRIDVDDLIAFSLALDTTPAVLLLPPEPELVQLTKNLSVVWQAAWRWTHGEEPLNAPPADAVADTPEERAERHRQFVETNQPYRDRDHLTELARYLRARIAGPFHVELDYDGAREHGVLSLHSKGQPQEVGQTGLTAKELVQALRDAGVPVRDGTTIRGRTYGRRDKDERPEDGSEGEGRG